MTIIYILINLWAGVGSVGLRDMQVMAASPELNRIAYQKGIAMDYSNLEPSNVIIQAFLKDALLLDDFGIHFDLTHKKRAIIARQIYKTAMRESGLGKSKLAQKLNNHIGTKLARKRFTWAAGKGYLNYAKFDNWTYSYLDCQEYILKYGMSWIK
jgi:hypothetical protein